MDPQPSCALPVVLVPGLGLGAESWSPTVQALHRKGMCDRGPVRTVLLPGYGRPGRNRTALAPQVLAHAVVAELGREAPALLVGLSAGCQVAAHAALQAPDRVAGLVLVGPTTDPRADSWPRLVRRWAATARSEPIRQLPALLRQYRRTGLPSMVRAMDAARRDGLQHVVPLLTCPTLLLRGAHDRIAPEDWLSSLTERVPDQARDGAVLRRWVSLAAGAHMVPFTHGELVARAIREFLAELGDRSSEAGSGR